MIQNKDIIGIVRELKQRHEAVPAGTDLMSDGKAYGAVLDVWHTFPAVADALLIAVETLEDISPTGYRLGQPVIWCEEDEPCSAETAMKALSRIPLPLMIMPKLNPSHEFIPPKNPDPMPSTVEWRQVRSLEELELIKERIMHQQQAKKFAQAHPYTHQMIRSFGKMAR